MAANNKPLKPNTEMKARKNLSTAGLIPKYLTFQANQVKIIYRNKIIVNPGKN
jgi:hypothetical protein